MIGRRRIRARFYRAASYVRALSFRKAVRPSVCPSVCHTRELLQNERKFCRHSYTISTINLASFPTRRMVGGGCALLREILGQTDPLPRA